MTQEDYWDRLLAIYDAYTSIPEDLSPGEKWQQAYQKIERELGTYKEPEQPPSYDPPAQTPQQFASQYAEAIVHMMSTHSSHLQLPKDFMENWHQAEKDAEKEGSA